ncbi:hypothetical protein DUNSADRAFT_14310 [Dunaliella salina]|uniref:Uncharacterized protein n=1 Tax=Dunaliella salina TaxID=3046 RepID=A0ABQ7H2T0_DUNSA|nr:hypothetical protein DUNSADRAFT_14310 [Dunaliella salina]|eukprot:KAF5841135.1 hypothetical protein DUNSADRAFT_14310 [Dunaliella salina]
MRAWTLMKGLLWQPCHAFAVMAKRWPASTGVGCTVVKTAAADLFAQKVIEGKEQIDWRRNSVFSSFGFAYLGLWQYYLYAGVFPKIATRAATVLGERGVPPLLTFLDQCVHHPVLYFPSFYLLRGYVGGESAELSMQKCQEDFWTNLKALWVVWVPSQYVNFKYMPTHMRVPFVAAVSAVWCVIMSVFRGESATVAQKEEIQRMQELVAASAVAAAAAEAAKEGGAAPSPPPPDSPGSLGSLPPEQDAIPAQLAPEKQGAPGLDGESKQHQQPEVLPDPIHGGCMPMPVCRSFA